MKNTLRSGSNGPVRKFLSRVRKGESFMLKDILKTLKFWAISITAVVFFLSGGEMRAQSGSDAFVSFDQFLSATAAAVYNSTTMPKVANAAAFEEMRQHILKINEGMQVTHSFAVGSQTYDCMAIESQPAIRLLGLKGVATPPAPIAPPAGATGVHTSILPASGVDRFGNAIGCQDKTVPIGRTTLEQMNRFPALQAFLRQGPAGKGKSLAAKDSSGNYVDDQNLTSQTVYNLGVSSTLSVNQPELILPIEVPGSGGIDSGSYFIIGGGGGGIFSGWSVFPGYFGDQQPHLFAKFIGNGSCNDYDCGAFVQYDGSVFLGVPLSPGGEVTIQWLWVDGNWWLQVNGTWVGYYPGVLFGGGDMATHADSILVGGFADGNYYIPQMGSGQVGTSGYPYAAYHRQIFYFDGAYNATYAYGLSNPASTCPSVTSTLGPYWGGSGYWGVYFFFGGPGGPCQ